MTASAFLVGAIVALATPLLARSGWLRAARDRDPERAPVAPVGGLALGLALLVTGALSVPWTVVAVLLLGVCDDRFELKAGLKFSGQLLLSVLLWLELVQRAGFEPRQALTPALALPVLVNLFNTWDHADGFCAGLGALALWPTPASLGLLGFLPWNFGAKPRTGRGRPPVAYLGDSGSHLVGLLIALQPGAWPLALLPAVDLMRVASSRWRSGIAPWVGDRRHLGHLLQRAGLGPLGAAGLVTAASLPLAFWGAEPLPLLSAAGAYGTLFLWSVRSTACPEAPTSR